MCWRGQNHLGGCGRGSSSWRVCSFAWPSSLLTGLLHLPSSISSQASLYTPHIPELFLMPPLPACFPMPALYPLCALRMPFPHRCRSKAYSSFRTWFKGHLLLNLLSHPPLPGSDLSLSELPGRFPPLIMFYSISSLTSSFLGQKLCFIFCPPLSPA